MVRKKTPKLVTQYLKKISRQAREIHFRLRRDLTVRFVGKVYPSPSAAAKAACKRPANGWWFGHYERSPGDWVRIDALTS